MAVLCVLGCAIVATLRAPIGNVLPTPALHLYQPAEFEPRAVLASVPRGWSETFVAAGIWLAEVTQELGGAGLFWLPLLVLVATGLWFLATHLNNRRTPSVPLALLLALQLSGGFYYLASFRAPSYRLESSKPGTATFTAFDAHCHTTHSNGLLTPQQQIDWHRARGFGALAFTDSNMVMPAAELAGLRAANPDMHLLNGCEYHGAVHLIVLGATAAVSARDLDVPQAIRAAKAQGALVIAAHPWSARDYTPAQLLELGVDGFEAWNGIIWSRDLAELDRARKLVATTATDTLSKSGSHCHTWTLLPRGLKDDANVLRALRLRKMAVAHTLTDDDTPGAFDARRKESRRPRAVVHAAGRAWHSLTRAERYSAVLGWLAIFCLIGGWGAAPRRGGQPLHGPNFAVGYLRRRRLPTRLFGLALMLLAYAGSLAAALLAFGATIKGAAGHAAFNLLPWHALIVWLLLDALYLYGRKLWRRSA